MSVFLFHSQTSVTDFNIVSEICAVPEWNTGAETIEQSGQTFTQFTPPTQNVTVIYRTNPLKTMHVSVSVSERVKMQISSLTEQTHAHIACGENKLPRPVNLS